MNSFECSIGKPWGIHPTVRNDEGCPRCGWIAPGPLSHARGTSKGAPLTLPMRLEPAAPALAQTPRKAA